MTTQHPHDHEPIRDEVQALARENGITEAFVALLVDEFYKRIRAHESLGPIFERAIGNRWDAHLDRMNRFWRAITLYTGEYSGRPVPVHKKLAGITEADFDEWLALFRQTLDDIAPNQFVADHFAGKAAAIATSLRLAMFHDKARPSSP